MNAPHALNFLNLTPHQTATRPARAWRGLLAGLALAGMLTIATSAAAAVAPAMGAAQGFAVLGASAITNTGATVITGDLGISPNNASSVTGFPPGMLIGAAHYADAVALQAQNSLTTAYNALAGQACNTTISADLGGTTLVPGVYCSASSLGLTGTLTLDAQGDPNAVFVFKSGSTLTTASAARVVMINGGSLCNVYWQVGSSATLGTGTSFVGSILAQSSITLTTGASVTGRVMARTGAVTMDGNAVALCKPDLTTQASPAVTLGASVSDSATLLGGASPTGTIIFRLYGPNDATCSGAAIYSSSVAVSSGNGNYVSGSFTPTAAGTYRWIANYGGDANNPATSNACNAPNENVVVANAGIALMTLTTQASAGVTLGGPISDSATLSGGVTPPTGSITFNLYGPNDSACTGAVIFTSTALVSGNGTYASGSFTPATAGTYRWIANYSGDANNAATANTCNAANENVLVARLATTLSTQASAGIVLGGVISDTATLSGGSNPTGSITFRLYGPNDAACTGAVIFAGTATVNGNGSYPSGTFRPVTNGTYRWIANYSGDANNAATANACNAANESVLVTAPVPPGASQPVPTLSEWAMILLASLLALTGFAARRRNPGGRNHG